MKKFLILILSLALLLPGTLSCERYEVSPENEEFVVSAIVGDVSSGSAVPVRIFMMEGSRSGQFYLNASVVNRKSGASPSWTLKLNGESTVSPSSAWTFDENGEAYFTIEGLPSGSYEATLEVKRWYHYSSTKVFFKVL